jgi:hypothetical protein
MGRQYSALHPRLNSRLIWRVGVRRQSRIAPCGFRTPLAEPGVHLSICTGLSLDVLERLLIDCPEFARVPQGRSPELLSRYAEFAQSHSYHRLIPRGDGETLCP